MENLDIIIFTSFVAVAFVVFIITSFKEFSKMNKEDYTYTPIQKKFGRDAVYDLLETLFNETQQSNKDKIQLLKRIDRTISDMESDGMYFSDEVKEKLEKEREDLFCEYSGLPSPKAYNTNQI